MRTATAILEAKGAFKEHPNRQRRREPKAGGIGPAPDYLAEDERAVWDEVVRNCAPGVFQSSDRVVLGHFCRLEAESRRDPAKFGARKLGVLVSLAGRFGMSPADRMRVQVDPPKSSGKKTGLAQFL